MSTKKEVTSKEDIVAHGATPRATLVESTVVDATKPFLEIQKVSDLSVYPLSVYNGNPRYIFRWCNMKKMAHNRRGIWHAVNRTHPDFAELMVENDDSPDKTYISRGDLVLCCARKETVESKRELLAEKVRSRSSSFDAGVRETVARVGREGVRNMSKKTRDIIDSALEEDDNLI